MAWRNVRADWSAVMQLPTQFAWQRRWQLSREDPGNEVEDHSFLMLSSWLNLENVPDCHLTNLHRAPVSDFYVFFFFLCSPRKFTLRGIILFFSCRRIHRLTPTRSSPYFSSPSRLRNKWWKKKCLNSRDCMLTKHRWSSCCASWIGSPFIT